MTAVGRGLLLVIAASAMKTATCTGHATYLFIRSHRLCRSSTRSLSSRRLRAQAQDWNNPPQKVAIVGGGLAGLATAHHLLQLLPSISVTIFDPREPGKAEASSVAGGLLHPLSPKNKLLWMGEEGFKETWRLVEASKAGLEAHEPESVGRLHSPPDSILRPALTEVHEKYYPTAAAALPQWLTWLPPDEFCARVGVDPSAAGKVYRGGLVLRRSTILSMSPYLRGLWWDLTRRHGQGVSWVRQRVGRVQDLASSYDVVVLAMGAGLRGLEETAGLEVELVQGRTLLLDTTGQQLDVALLCGEYVVPGWDGEGRVVRCGATREYLPHDAVVCGDEKEEEQEPASHDDRAMSEFKEKVRRLYPPSADMPLSRVTTGTRVGTKRSNLGKLPIVGPLGVPKPGEREVWVFTGLGGRGLIHHAVLGKALALSILRADLASLPPAVIPKTQSTK